MGGIRIHCRPEPGINHFVAYPSPSVRHRRGGGKIVVLGNHTLHARIEIDDSGVVHLGNRGESPEKAEHRESFAFPPVHQTDLCFGQQEPFQEFLRRPRIGAALGYPSPGNLRDRYSARAAEVSHIQYAGCIMGQRGPSGEVHSGKLDASLHHQNLSGKVAVLPGKDAVGITASGGGLSPGEYLIHHRVNGRILGFLENPGQGSRGAYRQKVGEQPGAPGGGETHSC